MKLRSSIPLVGLAFIWGIYYVASNKAVEEVSVFAVGILIRLITMLLLALVMQKKGELPALLKIKGVRGRVLSIGLMGFLLGFTAFCGLQMSTTTGIGTALLKTDILFVNLISIFIYKQHFSKKEWLFTLVMMFGVLLVMGLDFKNFVLSDASFIFFILSALFISINAFLIKSVQRSKVNPVSSNTIAFYNNLVTMCFFTVTAAVMGTIGQIPSVFENPQLLIALLVSAIAQTGVYIVYYYNLANFPVWLVKVFLLIMPIVTSLISFILFDEMLGVKQLVGMAVVLLGALGILIVQHAKEEKELAEQM